MQNFNMARALGNAVKAYIDTEKVLLTHDIPGARKAKIKVIWLTWGLSEQELDEMDPGVLRTFSWSAAKAKNPGPHLRPGEGQSNLGEARTDGGLGVELGEVPLDNGTVIDAGRALMRGTWNAKLHESLEVSYIRGGSTKTRYHFHKNRKSGMCDRMTEMTEYLRKHKIRTLLFAGTYTDQCVRGTLQDASLKDFDAVLLKDGCGTNSPEYAQLSAEYNCLRSWGFLSSCKELAEAVIQT